MAGDFVAKLLCKTRRAGITGAGLIRGCQGKIVVSFKQEMTTAGAPTTLILAVTIMLYPLVAVFSPKAMVALLVLTALACLFIERNRQAVFSALPRVVLSLLAVLAAWSLVTIWWSPRPLGGLTLWLRVVGIGLCGMVLWATATKAAALHATAAERRLLLTALAASGWFFVALFATELFTGGSLSRLVVSLWNLLTPWDSGPTRVSQLLLQSSAALAVFAWPCMLAIRRRNSTRTAVLFGIAVGGLLLIQNMQASLVAFAGGMAVYAVVYKFRRRGIAAFLVGLAVVNLALVLIAFEFVSVDQGEGVSIVVTGSTKERLYILDYVYEKIAQYPLSGWGFDGSRAIGQDTRGPFSNNRSIPLHPHNLWAQTWLELGLIGVVLVISLVVSISMRLAAGGRGRAVAAAAAATVASYLLIGNISYGMWQNWWLAIAWLNAGFLAVIVAADGGAEA